MVRITDPRGAVNAGLVLSAVQELRDAGAEAIQINDVRVVAASWFDDGSSGLVVSGTKLRAPYTIYAIGDARTIAEALRRRRQRQGSGRSGERDRAHGRHRECVAARADASVRSAGAIQLVISGSFVTRGDPCTRTT
jgi:hypothetical protein